jgi:hypothetical protein
MFHKHRSLQLALIPDTPLYIDSHPSWVPLPNTAVDTLYLRLREVRQKDMM